METFRRLMGVEDSEYYQSYKHLNAKIIKPAVAEVNKVSDIVITPEIRKQGRNVTHIRFTIDTNPQFAIMNIDDGAGVRNSPIYDQLRGLNVSDRLARQWIAQHGAEYVSEKIAYTLGQGGVTNPVKYLSAAIDHDYSETPVAAPVPVSERAKRLRIIQDLSASRSPTQRDADRRLFGSTLDTADARDDFERHGWMSALNHADICEFWQDLFPNCFDEAV